MWRWLLGVVCAGTFTGMLGAQQVDLVPQLGLIEIGSIDLSRDGQLMLCGTGRGQVWLWDIAAEAELRSFPGVKGAISPNGKLVLTSTNFTGPDDNDMSVWLWDSPSGAKVRQLKGHTKPVLSVAFSYDGTQVLTGSADGTARVWHVSDGAEQQQFKIGSEVTSARFSKDGKRVVTTSRDHKVRVFDVQSASVQVTMDGGTELLEDAQFSPDGRYVISGARQDTDATRYKQSSAHVWDAATGQELHKINGAFVLVDAVSVSADGSLMLTGGVDDGVRVWDMQTGQLRRTIQRGPGLADYIKAVTFASSGHGFIAATSLGLLLTANADSDEAFHVFKGHTASVLSTAATSDTRWFVTGSINGDARLWDTTTGSGEASIGPQGAINAVWSVAISPDNSSVLLPESLGAIPTVRTWSLSTRKELQSYAKAEYPARFSSDGHFVIAKGSIFDSHSQKQIRTYDGTVAFSNDGQQAITWNSMDEMNSFLQSHLENRDGKLVQVWPKVDNSATIWNTVNGKSLLKIADAPQNVTPLGFSPDKTWMITAEASVTLRDTTTGKILRTFDDSGSIAPRSSLLSADGKLFLAGDQLGYDFRSWDVATGKILQTFHGHQQPTTSLTLVDHGRFVLSSSSDTTARLWDTSTGKLLVTMLTFEDGGWAVTDPTGRFDTNRLDGGAPIAWVVDAKPLQALPLEIFMRDYYTPGLLSRVLSRSRLPPVRSIAEIKNRVQPDVKVLGVKPSTVRPDRVDVTVHAASHYDSEAKQDSGLQDVHLFRDGRLVPNVVTQEGATYTFHDVLLPSHAKKVSFTAYAFSNERIKSATAVLECEPGKTTAQCSLPASQETPAQPKAYLLQIGENHYAAKGCDLQYSVNDAEAMSTALSARLAAQSYKVLPVKLESVAGGSTDAASRKAIIDALAKIAASATPDDVFFMSFSGHGYASGVDHNDEFYLLPSDVQGSCHGVDATMLQSAISASQLAEWLRPIDAGEMTVILDACNSADSVQSGDFRPGPMGSRGLGQLAYDKRMRVLAASQSDEAAHEYDALHSGLLTYVLTHEGLDTEAADWKPIDRKIMLGEWLGYAANEVPLFHPVAAGADAKKSPTVQQEEAGSSPAKVQQPALFDFSKSDTFTLETVKP